MKSHRQYVPKPQGQRTGHLDGCVATKRVDVELVMSVVELGSSKSPKSPQRPSARACDAICVGSRLRISAGRGVDNVNGLPSPQLLRRSPAIIS